MVRIYTRAEWGARYQNGFGSAPVPWHYNILHHSVTTQLPANATFAQECAQMRIIEQIGQDRFGGGMSYTVCVFPSGRAFEGHSHNRQGAHTSGMNDRARAICFVGNYETTEPTPAMLNTASEILKMWKDNGWVKEAKIHYGHRDLKATSCPGIRAYRKIGEINRLASLEDDMAYTEEQLGLIAYRAISAFFADAALPENTPSWARVRFRGAIAPVVAPLMDDEQKLTALLNLVRQDIANQDTSVELSPEQLQELANDLATVLPANMVDEFDQKLREAYRRAAGA